MTLLSPLSHTLPAAHQWHPVGVASKNKVLDFCLDFNHVLPLAKDRPFTSLICCVSLKVLGGTGGQAAVDTQSGVVTGQVNPEVKSFLMEELCFTETFQTPRMAQTSARSCRGWLSPILPGWAAWTHWLQAQHLLISWQCSCSRHSSSGQFSPVFAK